MVRHDERVRNPKQAEAGCEREPLTVGIYRCKLPGLAISTILYILYVVAWSGQATGPYRGGLEGPEADKLQIRVLHGLIAPGHSLGKH